MKRSTGACGPRLGRALAPTGVVALMLAAAAPQALAVSPKVDIKIQAGPKRVDGRIVTSMLSWQNTFSTDTPGADPFTVQQAVVLFPDRTKGRFFPSCSAAQIERRGGIGGCPKDARIGTGKLTAKVVPAGVAAEARITAFNSNRGRSITFNIRASTPAVIDMSFDAPLTLTSGPYPMKMVMDVPPSLQEVLPGLFVGLETFNLTISGVTKVHGKRHHFLPLVCPKRGAHAEFTFLDPLTRESTTAAADADLDCHDLT